jgi:hypothetical protein
MNDTANQPTTDVDEDVKLSRADKVKVAELQELAKKLRNANLLYGSALDGMQSGLASSAQALDDFKLNDVMAAVDDANIAHASEVLESDAAMVEEIESELADDDDEEEKAESNFLNSVAEE